jgi:hypothetical protein
MNKDELLNELIRKIELTAEIWELNLVLKEVKNQNFIFVFHIPIPKKIYPENIEISEEIIIPLIVQKENSDKLLVMIPIEFKESIDKNKGVRKYINKILLDFTKITEADFYYATSLTLTPKKEIILEKGVKKSDLEKWHQTIIFREGEGDDLFYKELPPGCLLNNVDNPACFPMEFLKRVVEGESFCRYCEFINEYCPNQRFLKRFFKRFLKNE